MKIWVTTIGTTIFAVINTLWTQLDKKQFIPNAIYIIYNEEMQNRMNIAKQIIDTLNETYNIDIETKPVKYSGTA